MRESSSSFTLNEWRRLVAALCLSAAVFIAAILVTRLPAAGTRLSPWWTLATALVISGLGASAIAALSFQASRRLTSDVRSALAIAVSGLAAISVLATTSQAAAWQLAFGCLLSVSLGGAFLVWAVLSGGEQRSEVVGDVRAPADNVASTVAFTAPTVRDDDGAEEIVDQLAHALPDHVDQTLSRYTADGRDHLEACLRVRFEPGQQTAIVHLPIQPAMQFDPEVECEPVGGNDLRVSVDPAQPYGVRLVCRRSAPCNDAGESIVAVLISADRVARAAA